MVSFLPFQISSVEDDRFYSSPGDLTGMGGLISSLEHSQKTPAELL